MTSGSEFPTKTAPASAALTINSVSSDLRNCSSKPLSFKYVSIFAICEHVGHAPYAFLTRFPNKTRFATSGPLGKSIFGSHPMVLWYCFVEFGKITSRAVCEMISASVPNFFSAKLIERH